MALGPGSIAFSGFNADGVDHLAFVALEEIPAGTTFYFNDNEWNGTSFNTGESIFSFTAGQPIAPGAVVLLGNIGEGTIAANGLGTAAIVDGTNRGLSNSDETLYVYLADAATPAVPTAFLTAVSNSNFGANGGLDNTGLAAGTNALNLGARDDDLDIAAFTGSRTSQTNFAAYRALLNDHANWNFQDASGDQSADGIAPDAPFSADPFTTGGVESQSVSIGPATQSQPEGQSGATLFSFTVTRTGGTNGELSFSGTFAAQETDGADFTGAAVPAGFSGTIAAGQSSATVTISVAGDTAVEPDEDFALTLTSVSNSAGIAATIAAGSATATATIANDDAAPSPYGPGSIAFVGFNADGNDDLAFVALQEIAAGTTIYFNDREWQGDAFNTGEGEVAFTAAAAIAPGTIVTISSFSASPTSNAGSVTGSSGIGNSDEIVYAFVGAPNNPSAFLAAIANSGFAVDGGTLAGTGLVVGETAIDLAGVGGNAAPDIAVFDGARGTAPSFADYASIINDSANWIAQDASGDQSADGTAPDLPFNLTAFTIDGTAIGDINVFDALPSLQGDATPPDASDDVVLVRVGEFTGSGATAAGRAESVSFDADTGRIFVTNAAQARIDIAELDADGGATALPSIDLAGLTGYGGVNSVAVANGIVAVAYQNAAGDQGGYVALYDSATATLRNLIQVGVLPDQVTFTPDGTKILTANEGETLSPGNNPAGSVSIIDVSAGAAAAAVINTISFAALTGSEAELKERGLALFPGQAAGNDVEPEYVSVSPDGTRAYVTLQEVNAVAVIDLTDPAATQPIAIQPLGGIDRNLAGNAFDPNDQNGISLINADVVSLLQPDAIASFEANGATYFVTANEGDARVGGLADEARLSSSAYILDPTAYPNAAALKANNALGRLNVITSAGDTDGDGDIDQITTFGGRSITIFRQEADGSITKVRETGGEFEAIIARDFPALFNTENQAGLDNRSDNKGPEPEGVSVGQVGNRLYAFITLERVGGVMIYDVTDPETASFVTYRPATAKDFAPETSDFVAGADNPTGEALLLTANEVSGTTTIYRVVEQNDQANIITGGKESESFEGRGGDDRLSGLGGNDALDGGSGTDTAVYRGARSDYLIERTENGSLAIRDMRDGSPDGADLVSSVELFEFANGVRTAAQLVGGDAAPIADDRQGYVTGRGGNDELLFVAGDVDGTQLRGAGGNDFLQGGEFDDFLIGNGGEDIVVGGAGADQFRFFGNEIEGSADTDRIYDLDFDEGDRIVLGGFEPGAFAAGPGVKPFTNGTAVILDSFADLVSLDQGSDRVALVRAADDAILRLTSATGAIENIVISDGWAQVAAAGGAGLM